MAEVLVSVGPAIWSEDVYVWTTVRLLGPFSTVDYVVWFRGSGEIERQRKLPGEEHFVSC